FLLGMLVFAAISGWRQGLVSGVLSFAGFIAGAVVGALIAPKVIGGVDGILSFVLAMGIVIVGAGVGNWLASLVGTWVRERVTWSPARLVDSVGGAIFGLLSVALILWMVGSAALGVPLGPVSNQVRGSTVLGQIDAAIPESAREVIDELRSALDSSGLPEAFAGFTLPPIIPVDEPDLRVAVSPEVRASFSSLVKVQGIAEACSSVVDGSGFVYAPNHVMTNAHVVAGMQDPFVQIRGTGQAYKARVVYLDTSVDVAVLYVPGLDAPTLDFAPREAKRGDDAVVAGFPGGGRLTATAARVRGIITARGTDIYDSGNVVREVYAVRGEVVPGNSGGPLLSPTGQVYGVVFAAAVGDPTTGYALTAAQVATAAKAGAQATKPVFTGSCARG
ncbi:MAG: MarP family serine protease, partial [Candidatus Nanopelagicales bacterium]